MNKEYKAKKLLGQKPKLTGDKFFTKERVMVIKLYLRFLRRLREWKRLQELREFRKRAKELDVPLQLHKEDKGE